MSYPFTLFTRPHGAQSEHEMTNILPADEAYLREHDIKISMENCGAFTCIWADDGRKMPDDDETPDELIHIVHPGQTCEDAMQLICVELRNRAVERMPS